MPTNQQPTMRNGLGLIEGGVLSKSSAASAPAKTAASDAALVYANELALRAQELILTDLDDGERAYLASCQKMRRQHTGCNTPFEEFFDSLVLRIRMGGMPTPDDVADMLEEFRDNWDAMSRDVARFIESYPSEVPHAAK
jgi:hypothetical protein